MPPVPRTNADLVRRALEAFAARDVERLLATLAPDVEWRPYSTVWETSFTGHDGVRRWMAEVTALWSELDVELERVEELDGERVLCVGALRGLATGSDQELRVPMAAAVWTRSGLATRVEFSASADTALAALGESGGGD
jgi:ketosteroid isomerase-like protein